MATSRSSRSPRPRAGGRLPGQSAVAFAGPTNSRPWEGSRPPRRHRAPGLFSRYHLLPAARTQLLARLDRRDEAAEAYDRALALVPNEAERRFLERELARL
jgi:hypothetical protein